VNSSHVRKDILQKRPWLAEGNASRIKALLPSMLLSEELAEGEMPASFEIMHIFVHQSFEATLNMPESFSPLLILQLRRKGSSQVLPFVEPLSVAWDLYLPLTKQVPEDQDSFLGTRQIPYGTWFDYSPTRGDREANWFWSTQDMLLQTRPDPRTNDNLMQMRMYTLEHSMYSIFQVEEGCDGAPKSRVYQDHCAECGGDNSTCSGCDGVPNTGRDKGCSGHGECKEILGLDEIKCQCVDKYYDVMCDVYCDDKEQCSGNGMCHPEDGKKCICFQGWLHGDADFPGPFCNEPDPNFSGVSAGVATGMTEEDWARQQEATNMFLLTVFLPAALGAVVVLYGCYRVLWRRKIQEARLRKELLFIPQPQLKIKAEERIDDIIAAPDLNGWNNIELPEDRDEYRQGAASGQYTAAHSATLRHSVGEAAQGAMEYRANAMRKNVNAKNTVSKYIIGPDRPMPPGLDEEMDEAEGAERQQPQSNSSFLGLLQFPSATKGAEDHIEVAI